MAYIGNNPLMEFELEKNLARKKVSTERDVFPYVMRMRPQWKMYAHAMGKPYVDWLYDKARGRAGASQQLKAKWDAEKATKAKRRSNVLGGIGEVGGELLGGALKGAASELTPDPWYLKAGAAGLVAMVIVAGGAVYYITRPPK